VHTRAEQLVEGLDLVALEMGILRAAGRMGPALLRSLDAVHLASAQALGADLGGIVTYNNRVADAARAAGIPVFQPRS
jgi:predicted nucleic acid-binding protein